MDSFHCETERPLAPPDDKQLCYPDLPLRGVVAARPPRSPAGASAPHRRPGGGARWRAYLPALVLGASMLTLLVMEYITRTYPP